MAVKGLRQFLALRASIPYHPLRGFTKTQTLYPKKSPSAKDIYTPKYSEMYNTVEPPVSDHHRLIGGHLREVSPNSNLTDGRTNRDFG